MRALVWWRTGSLVAFGLTVGVAACGSDDGSKKLPGTNYPNGGEGGVPSAGGGKSDAGEGTAANAGEDAVAGSAGTSSGGVDGEGGTPTSLAGAGPGGSESTGGAGGAGGSVSEACLVEPPGTSCPAGTADCDGDATDCETDVTSDESNCGRCDRVCGAAAQCTSGLCGPTVILDPNVSSNFCSGAFTATTAYMITCWGNNDLSEVRSAPLEPGADVLGTQIKAYNNVRVVAMRGILVDGNDVLFGLQESPSHLYRFPLGATGPADVSVAYTFENNQRFDDLRLIGDTFWWNHNTHTGAGSVQPSTIEKRAKTETSSTVVVSGLGLSSSLQVFDQHLLWLEQRTAQSTVSVYRAPVAGATVAETELIAVATAGAFMKRQGDYVYWTHKQASPNGKLRRFKADDQGAEAEDVATGLNLPEGLITDEKYAYFKQADALYRVPLCGGTPQQLSPAVPAHDAQATSIFHVDDHYLYFAAGSGFGASTLVRVAK
ncbi:MAG: Stigma-specific protein Stig1 [Polyangiaceae bacterium]|jgi:hypothetical protein|nr:Stigma-specific protein Stig1 [Polyangiaceae bacterium]